jgi:hypothetical protein
VSDHGDERNDDEVLPFDVERERLPTWAQVSSALVIVVGVLVAAHLVSMLVFLPFLVASSLGRRFASTASHVEVDADGLMLDGRRIPRGDILDVFLDESEPRAAVAFGERAELAVLYFPNADQARRFADALTASTEEGQRAMVVGYMPRPVDALASLRFIAITLTFVATGAWIGLSVLVFFLFGASAFVRAKQVIARADGFEIRSVLGRRAHAYADVESVDVDAGVIGMKGGEEVAVPRAALRDTTLASPPWLDRARTRMLERIRARKG